MGGNMVSPKPRPQSEYPKGLICFVTKSLLIGQLPWKSGHSEKLHALPARHVRDQEERPQKVTLVLPFEVEPHPALPLSPPGASHAFSHLIPNKPLTSVCISLF